MSDVKSPSPVIGYFVREIEPSLPEAEKAKLGSYSGAIAKTTYHGDFKRAHVFAEWAVEMAERSSSSHLGHFVKHLEELRKLEKDTFFGMEFGIGVRTGGVGPGEDVEIQWVDDAVAIAKAEGQRVGWDSVPWENPLKESLAIADEN